MSELILKLIDSGTSALRGTLDADGNPAFSLFDMGNVACNKDRDSTYGKNNFYRLNREESEFKKELDSFCVYLKVPGSGQRKTPCASIRGLQRYLMMLGGKVAAEFREIIEGTFTRVMAGDQSLIEVINANAASQAPIQQAYRAALVQEPVAPVLDELCLGKKREREDILFDMELAERKVALEERKLTHAAKVLQHTGNAIETIDSLKNKANMDERTKMQIEDYIKNTLFNTVSVPSPSPLAITADAAPAVNATAPINVSIVAKELGVKLTDAQLQRVGREMAKRYREQYNSDPPKHKQFVNGNYIPVNSYMERDRVMMEQVIRAIGCE